MMIMPSRYYSIWKVKYNNMKISCLMSSHNKPDYVKEAIEGILSQTHQDWELIIMDSGVLYDQGYYHWKDKRIRVYKTGETEEDRRTKAMAPWSFNECFRRGLVDSELVVVHTDDDVLYSHAFETFNKWMENDIAACYASVDLAFYVAGKEPHVYGQLNAFEIGGKDAHKMDCRVDSLQICHRKEVFVEWPEELSTSHHADGVFMERLGKNHYIYPIPVKIGQNRRTPLSTYKPYVGE